jgi:hypothetical protein
MTLRDVARRLAVLVVLIGLVWAGYVYLPYVGWSDSHADAEARAKAYLAAVVGGSEDRGWSLLVPDGRDAFGSEDEYRQVMADADWSAFDWELRYNGVCDDGVCSFVLHLPNGADSAPEAAWSDGPGDPGVLAPTYDAPQFKGEAFLEVRQRGWFGGIGVWVHRPPPA